MRKVNLVQKVKKIPLRQCIACRTKKPKREMVRIVRNPQGKLLLDLKGKLPGRGAYICVSGDCFRKATIDHLFARHLDAKPDAQLLAELENLIGDNPN